MPVSTQPIAILNTGLVTPVGLSAPATCSAMRAKIANPSETSFIDAGGEWMMAHQVLLDEPWHGIVKLTKMAGMAIREAMANLPRIDWDSIPLLLCVAENDRPGRLAALDETLLLNIEKELGTTFAQDSAVIAEGRVGVAVALSLARRLIYEQGIPHVLIMATDSLVSWPTLNQLERDNRLLTSANSNGFIAGEGAGAMLVAKPASRPQLCCTGIGFGTENAHIYSDEPLRADGLTRAIKTALLDGQCDMHEMAYRITDLSGEQYYFKEAALAVSRTLRQIKDEFDLWHPAECIGECGALVGISIIALADFACRKGFAKGTSVLAHMGNDYGKRAALSFQFREAG